MCSPSKTFSSHLLGFFKPSPSCGSDTSDNSLECKTKSPCIPVPQKIYGSEEELNHSKLGDSPEDFYSASPPYYPSDYHCPQSGTQAHSCGENEWNTSIAPINLLTSLTYKQQKPIKAFLSVIDLEIDTQKKSPHSFNPLDFEKAFYFTDIPNEEANSFSSEYRIAALNKRFNRYHDMIPKNSKIYAPTIGNGYKLLDYYLNAVKISAKIGEKTFDYITTQAPLPETFNNFFKAMIVGGSKIIINLSMLTEKNKIKCNDYWSDDYWASVKFMEIKDGHTLLATLTKALGKDEVLLKDNSPQNIATRKITCTPAKGEPFEIIQIHYEGWPDFGTPDAKLFMFLIDYLNNQSVPVNNAPWTIHCSAGVGRTGTFIAAHALDQQIKKQIDNEKPPCVDAVTLVKKMREERCGMIQTDEQWQFLHEIIHLRAKTHHQIRIDKKVIET